MELSLFFPSSHALDLFRLRSTTLSPYEYVWHPPTPLCMLLQVTQNPPHNSNGVAFHPMVMHRMKMLYMQLCCSLG